MSALLAAKIAAQLDAHFPEVTELERHLLNGVAFLEETGEVAGALRRYLGLARRTGTLTEVAAELADSLIALYVMAHYLGIDLDTAVTNKADVIFARGFKDPR